jgi:hypothetical protein
MTKNKPKKRKKKKTKYHEVLNYPLRKLKRSVVIENEHIEIGYSKEADAE